MAIVVALFATACAWGQAGGNAARNGSNPFEPGLTVDNVSGLALAWQTAGGGEPVMNDKYLYSVMAGGRLGAFAAGGPASPQGASRCTGSPSVCTPVWFSRLSDSATAPFAAGAVVVDGDQVFGVGYLGGSLRLIALDADPATCPSTPDGCAPQWTGQWGGNTLFGFSLTVADGRVYISSYPNDVQGFPYVVAFDEHGVTNCTAGPPRTCSPLFRFETNEANGLTPSVAVAGGHLFVSQIGNLAHVFDATGQSGCTNGICSELYRLASPGAVSVSGTTAYAADRSTLTAFDATGATCPGNPGVCRPLWSGTVTGSARVIDPPTVSNGKVFVFEDGSPFPSPVMEAFDAAGVERCTGSPVTCLPLWGVDGPASAGFPDRLSATPSLLFMSGATVKAFDLAGSRSCAGTPKRCTALATVPTGDRQVSTRAAVAFGRVAVSDSDLLRVFALPG